MKLLPVLVLLLFPITATSQGAASLSAERQQEIVDMYRWVRGQSPELPHSVAEHTHDHDEALKCGFPAVSDFIGNRDKIDPSRLKGLGSNLFNRPVMDYTHTSPSGIFLIHYNRTGDSAVYRANVDDNGNGVPDYVDTVAMILDSTYDHTVNQLGFPPHIDDSFYPQGGDDKFDVYISNLGGQFFGLSYPDSLFVDNQGVTVATAWMEIDNDYQEIGFIRYRNRPLDAARVTIAHEYFHAVQFAMDYLETEIRQSDGFVMRYWMEMSSVWMEEQQYDDINDYYTYLTLFFNGPRTSIQQFRNAADLHPYASAVFPIFMTEKYNENVMLDLWTRCRLRGSGPSFFDAVVGFADSVTTATGEFTSMPGLFSEFSVWNFFTGDRSGLAPNNMGYPEKWVYPQYPSDSMAQVDEYPVTVTGNQNIYAPEHNGEAFLIWDQTQALNYSQNDTLFFLSLNDGQTPSLPDPWGAAFIYQLDQDRDSFEVDYLLLPDDGAYGFAVVNATQYRSLTIALSPASRAINVYQTRPFQPFGYVSNLTLDSSLIDTTGTIITEDPEFIAVPSMFMAPYPNPAVVAEMTDPVVRFRVDVQFDSANFIFYQADPLYLVADIFNAAGEYIANLRKVVSGQEEATTFTLEWDMRNGAGTEVASGVYIALARLYTQQRNGQLLAEDEAKILIVK